MNPEIARAIIKYIKIIAPDKDKVNKGLKDIKLFLTQDDQNVHIFRKQGLTSLIANLFMKVVDERGTLWLLSILTSCLLHREFQEEVHNSTIIPAVVNVFKNTDNASIRHRACRVIGQQCTYDLSVSQFHHLNALSGVLSFLKYAKEDEEIKTAIKTLRFMANNSRHSKHILKEDGLRYVCIYVWIELTYHDGIWLLVSLVSTHKTNLHLLPELLRGLLGLENYHNDNKRAIEKRLEDNFLPVLLDIFDSALKKICNNPEVKSTWDCYHYPVKADDEKPIAFSKEVSKELLDFGGSQTQNSSTETKNTIHNTSSPEGSTPTFTYKKMNKIKFRTGKKVKVEDKNLVKTASENSKRLDCNSSILLNDDSPDKFKNNKEKHWNIGGLYEERDVSCLCKHFLKKLYQYFYYSPVVHQSALKFLSSIGRNTSSIQPIFDNLLIPKLTVDLVDGRLKDNCSQCSEIKRYVKEFLLNTKKYFNHHHPYATAGQCIPVYHSFLVHDIQVFTERK
ncbi:hypothetical protein Anas_07317 [Armadillidium nasatum]|uniref:Uncharacterized protein n=1 Tax=Armadillidium nasatum TaxID=96803 RepID=A0A5N5ST45_9CRUS|nr:hypothetical protein Anas_07317 [Armadillidium nasatum]